VLEVTLQGESVELPTDETIRKNVGPATIQVRSAYPAVWIATSDGSDRLALPDQSKLHSHIGLVFATPGSEESVLMPEQGVGMRIVQRSGSDNFVLEVYRSDAIQPIYRAELTTGGQLSVPFAPGEIGFTVSTLPGLQVDVRHLPGLWLVPVGILLALIGVVAFLRPSTFVTIQVAPWTLDQTVVILQSDHPDIISSLRAGLDTFPSLSLTEASDRAVDDPLPPPLSQSSP